MRLSHLPSSLAWLLLAMIATSSAQFTDDALSFGHKDRLSPNGGGIPNWDISSVNHNPQILSDRVILTPPVPGNARGALWSDNSVSSETWSAELEFRASGQEFGSGNLQLWFVKEKDTIGTNSVYTVEKFDGLALILDQYGGRGGGIRGFLNDGTKNYNTHNSLDSIAFGHCDYRYRNLGRPSKLKISSQNGLTVSIDGRDCFSSDQIILPSGYYFGITAATSENPDSFEINKLIVTTGVPPSQQNAGKSSPLQKLDRFPGSPEAVPDQVADEIKSQEEQFADLHNRLQSLTHQVVNFFDEIAVLSRKMDENHQKIMNSMPVLPQDTINTLNRRVENIEKTMEDVKREMEGRDYRQHLNDLNQAIERVRGGLTDALPDTINGIMARSAPRMGMFVFIVLAVQVMLAGAYVLYKRRRASMPKKYL